MDAAAMEALETRLNGYLDGLFWITVFGLGFIIGGMILMKRFQFSDLLILAYLAISSAAFLANFAINMRELQRLKAQREAATRVAGTRVRELSLPSAISPGVGSVTEQTTRNLEEVPNARDHLPESSQKLRKV
jgi:hypothetical protein